jgi:hypothetical protein
MSERLHEPNEIAVLRSKLKAAEGKIARAREALANAVVDEHWQAKMLFVTDALAILIQPANAEGIASEGGSGGGAKRRQELIRQGKMLSKEDLAEDYPDEPDGAEERYEKFERESAGWSARVQASIDALTQPDRPDWKARAGDLAHLLALAQPYIQASERSYARWLTGASSQALARYHEAIDQHGGEER